MAERDGYGYEESWRRIDKKNQAFLRSLFGLENAEGLISKEAIQKAYQGLNKEDKPTKLAPAIEALIGQSKLAVKTKNGIRFYKLIK